LQLFSILNLLDDDTYPSQDDFDERFGAADGERLPSVEQIKSLQARVETAKRNADGSSLDVASMACLRLRSRLGCCVLCGG
jgi:hypothetical protein